MTSFNVLEGSNPLNFLPGARGCFHLLARPSRPYRRIFFFFFFFFCYFLSWWVYGVRDINMENSLCITEQKIIFSWGGIKDVSWPWLHGKPKLVDLQINVCSWSESGQRLMGADSLTCGSRSPDGGQSEAHLCEWGLRTPPGPRAGQVHTDIHCGAGCGQSLALKCAPRSARLAMTGHT